MNARVPTRHFGSLQVQVSQFPSACYCLAVRHDLCHDSPFVGGARRQRLWIEQERLGSTWSGSIAPGCKNPVTRCNADSKMTDVLERRTFSCHDDIREEGVIRVDMGASLDGRDHRNADVRNVL